MHKVRTDIPIDNFIQYNNNLLSEMRIIGS